MVNSPDPKKTPTGPAVGQVPGEPLKGDKSPAAVAGPEAQKRERPQPYDPGVSSAGADGDPAPAAVAGPEAQKRERPQPQEQGGSSAKGDGESAAVAGPEAQARLKGAAKK